ncbi:class I SAM-dependent methyltransferase [Aspergillus ibericus CBS 121593]|uniref:S-adenosyl-L-methionine-dependent methyltransferase n=1 Tax=Aspergillus ibericus CBS 121593 TaxID=1448316 RepID=A0A395GWN7_9EURO|nr:S-adenosyl-L-methionine-dependent methyltransferase [Aspergillus ibericus CBS 121593]RAK99842.1 S-adenosyl-L-methionine-dependent methyltransferase [Aspergillus ibericus CBS 121593]
MEAPRFIAYESTSSLTSVTPAVQGTVLELGPGTGNQLSYFKSSAITRVYGVEYNLEFAEVLHAKVRENNLEDIYTPVFCDILDANALERHGIVENSIDCVTSFQVLCCTPDPTAVVAQIWKLLKPGGELVFWEHGASSDPFTLLAQKFWTLFWPTIKGGCYLDRNMRDILLKSADWEVVELRYEGEKASMMPRTLGRLRKVVAE